MIEGLHNPLFEQRNRLRSVNAALIEVLEMMPSSWWLLWGLCDCFMFSVRWMWYWRAAVATARARMVDLSAPTRCSPTCPSEGLSGHRVVVRAHVQTILCGGSVCKTKQMAHPLAVAWGPRASHAGFAVAIWQCGLVACTSCAVLPACDLVCSQFNTPLVADQRWLCALRLFVKLEWPCTDGFLFETHLFSNDFNSQQVLRHVWKCSICIPAVVSTCIHLNLVHQCYHCYWLELSFHPQLYETRQDWLSVNTCWLVLIILSFNSLLLPCQSFCKFFWHPH